MAFVSTSFQKCLTKILLSSNFPKFHRVEFRSRKTLEIQVKNKKYTPCRDRTTEQSFAEQGTELNSDWRLGWWNRFSESYRSGSGSLPSWSYSLRFQLTHLLSLIIRLEFLLVWRLYRNCAGICCPHFEYQRIWRNSNIFRWAWQLSMFFVSQNNTSRCYYLFCLNVFSNAYFSDSTARLETKTNKWYF